MLLPLIVRGPFKIVYVYAYRLFCFWKIFRCHVKTIDNQFDIEIGCESPLNVRVFDFPHPPTQTSSFLSQLAKVR